MRNAKCEMRNTNMRASLIPHPPSLILLIFMSAFFVARPALAEDVCCSCLAPGDTKNRTCLQTNDVQLGSAKNCSLLPEKAGLGEGWTCERQELDETKCRKVAMGGICVIGPMTADAAKTARQGETITNGTSEPAAEDTPLPFKLNIAIPGFSASAVTPTIFAEYLVALFRYVIGIIAVATTVMFIYGAFLYLLGSAITSIQSGKKIMFDAIVGMILVLSSTVILRTLNPNLLSLQAIKITAIEAKPYSTHLIGNSLAPDLLTELGIAPSAVIRPTNLKIPKGYCPGRDKSYRGDGGKMYLYTIQRKNQNLTDDIIDAYIQEQNRTGIPAGVIMAQIFNESGGACPVLNLFGDPSVCGGLHSKYYNFGGIGCTQNQVPSNACAHLAFPKAFVSGSRGQSYPMTIADVNKYWNSTVSPNCVTLLNNGATRDTYTNCGEKCYPQKSHTTVNINGKTIWIQSVMCARKFDNAQQFLNTHLQFVKACLPYNDSVYKFAYCIGASMYATAPDKALVLADIIERNCLCDPATDSLGCVRDRKLEQDLKADIVKKTNLLRLYSAGKLDQSAFDRITAELWKKTQGRLTPGPSDVINEEAAAREAKES
jgi:hypothetical protein